MARHLVAALLAVGLGEPSPPRAQATVGNPYTGQQATVGHAMVSGPGGQSTSVAQVNDQYEADHSGNTYGYNSSTGPSQWMGWRWRR